MRRTIILRIAACLAIWGCSRYHEAAKEQEHQASLDGETRKMIDKAKDAPDGAWTIHKGRVCPPGWQEKKGMFIEEDGKRQDGCMRVVGHPMHMEMDYLRSGETIDVMVPLAIPAVPEGDGRVRG